MKERGRREGMKGGDKGRGMREGMREEDEGRGMNAGNIHIPYSRESPPMGAASYFLTKQGGGRSFECFRIQP